jgi:hypothetical protein
VVTLGAEAPIVQEMAGGYLAELVSLVADFEWPNGLFLVVIAGAVSRAKIFSGAQTPPSATPRGLSGRGVPVPTVATLTASGPER